MTVLIIGAMDCEIASLREAFGAADAGDGVYTAKQDEITAVVAKCGVGKVNAAAVTQRLIDSFKPDAVINTGVAGGIADGIKLGETVVADWLTYHDFDPLELLDRYPPYTQKFTCSERLSALAREACGLLGTPYRRGVIVSGDRFVNDAALKKSISDRFGAACTEMEGAAVAHVCLLNSVPFTVIRSVCDFADASADMINEFESRSAENAAKITEYIIKNI